MSRRSASVGFQEPFFPHRQGIGASIEKAYGKIQRVQRSEVMFRCSGVPGSYNRRYAERASGERSICRVQVSCAIAVAVIQGE